MWNWVFISQFADFQHLLRRGRDSNPRYSCPYTAFRVRPDRPLRHLSFSVAGGGPCPVLPIQNRCFGTANIGIFFIFAHFRAEKITFGWKNASGGPVSAAFPELFVSLTSSEDTSARQNAGKFAFAFAGSYLCKRTDPLRACSIFRARPFIKKNDTKIGTVFVWYLKN